MSRPVALVTGSSRGIGRATAIEFARHGWDVAVAARTLLAGQGRDDSDTGQGTVALPGSIEGTACEVEEAGGRALRLVLDMADRAAIDTVVASVLGAWGRIDVVVNNAVHLAGTTTRLLDLTPETLERTFLVNDVNALYLIQRCLPPMLAAGRGVIVNVTSGAGVHDPPGPAGAGGWGVSYGMSKAALNRIAGVVQVEYGEHGIRAYTVSVHAETERAALTRRAAGFAAPEPVAPSVPASAIVWLAEGSPDAVALRGQLVDGNGLATELGLEAAWRPTS